MKRDDSTISPEAKSDIRKRANEVLRGSGARGIFPTPIDFILDYSELVVDKSENLNKGFLSKIISGAKLKVKRVVRKIMGVLDIKSRKIYIDCEVSEFREAFLKLHEAGHNLLPWQREMYEFIQDSKQTLSLETREDFEKEANVFASELLFQLDTFTDFARQGEFSILNPVKLSTKFGASIYSTIRRFVSESEAECALIVINPPKNGPRTLRRIIYSDSFLLNHKPFNLPHIIDSKCHIFKYLPKKRRRHSGIQVVNRDGKHLAIESFTNTYQIFVLVFPAIKVEHSYN